MDSVWESISRLPWYAWVAIVAIVCGTINAMMRRSHAHTERMAMIKQGMDPGRDPKD
ncbi:MAG: hypothetical protein ACYTG5_10275 [Planctomycetota bacterium]|jgi:hypothetical protein